MRNQANYSPGRPLTSPYPAWYQRLPVALWLVGTAIGAAGLLLILMAVMYLGLFGYYQTNSKIIPGVSIGGLSLTGLTKEQAAVQIHAYWNLEKRIVTDDGIAQRTVSPSSLGLTVDAAQTAQQAYDVGHDPFLLTALAQFNRGLRKGWQVEPVVLFDERVARQGLQDLAAQLSMPAQDATMQVSEGKAYAIPAKLGYTLNFEDTLQPLNSDPRSVLTGGYLSLRLMPVPATIQDASDLVSQAQAFISQPLTIRGYDPVTNEWLNWQVEPAQLSTWLAVEPGDRGPVLNVRGDQVAAYLASINAKLAPQRILDAQASSEQVLSAIRQGKSPWVMVNHNPSSYSVEKGDTLLRIAWKVGMPFWKILQANPGMDPNQLSAGQTIVIPSQNEMLPLPVNPNKRIVISISKQRMWVYQDGQQIQKFIISTGMNRSPTQPGIFQVRTHEPSAYASIWDLTMPDFLGIYEAWPGFMNGIHGLPTLSNGRRLWANILGRPASYGCIILNLDAAKWLYNWAENGVVVEIQG